MMRSILRPYLMIIQTTQNVQKYKSPTINESRQTRSVKIHPPIKKLCLKPYLNPCQNLYTNPCSNLAQILPKPWSNIA